MLLTLHPLFSYFSSFIHSRSLDGRHRLESLKLQRNINKYEILKDTNADDEDKTQFYYTKKSLECLGFTGDEILSVFKIIAVVLKLGNLNFIPITNIDGTEGCEITNDYGECEREDGERFLLFFCVEKPFENSITLFIAILQFSLSLFHFPFILSLFCSGRFGPLGKYPPQKSEILHSS